MNCKTCATEISINTVEVADEPSTCPACQSVFYIKGQQQEVALFMPSTRSLPSKMSIELLDDELLITRRWWSVVRLGLFGITSFLLIFGLFFSEIATPLFLFNPLTWMVIGLNYFGLKGVVNKTVVQANPTHLTIKEGPLLYPRSKTIDIKDIAQLYVKKEVQGSGKNRSISYQLHLIHPGGEHDKILSNFATADQALYVEQETERLLGLEDTQVKGEYQADGPRDFSGWQRFASKNDLHYTYGKLLLGHHVQGFYPGYTVELRIIKSRLAFVPKTRLSVTTVDEKDLVLTSLNQQTLETVATLVATPLESIFSFLGSFNITDEGKTFFYEESEVAAEADFLQFAFDLLIRFSQTYPYIVELGGVVIPVLQPTASNKKHPAQAVASQLIKEIAPTTEHLAQQVQTLLCPDCLVRIAAHKVDLGWSKDITYYGCRQCQQSKEFLTAQTVVAVLDDQAKVELAQDDQTLRVNALTWPNPFDFDAVTIIKASDEAVERFAVQVGNDTDPIRKSTYQQIRCTISPDCTLSENTVRILQQMFGSVVTS